MVAPLVECIANYSEARRGEVVEAIIQAIATVPGVSLLDRHSDLDHNRTVLTFVGPPKEIEEAAFRSIAKAAELIDLNQHTGTHPRIGATDVVPFVPIFDISMAECVEIAQRLGRRVGEELSIPVYLYEEAATRPERKNLENIRRGEYEALKAEIGTSDERTPDFGPALLGPAGATVIGARHPLIAFNVYLTTDDVTVAKKIARAIRHSNGGLRYVKALGMLVEGRAQVSMNLTNYTETPVARVVEMIRREATRYGVGIHHSELVGLIPEDALIDTATWYLQLDQFETHQVLERRLFDLMKSQSVPNETPVLPVAVSGSSAQEFLNSLAAGTPTPGGGSASAYCGAAGAALVEMVARLTIEKPKYAAVRQEMEEALEKAMKLRDELSRAVASDAAAFDGVLAAYHLPKGTPEEALRRTDAIQQAILRATHVPLDVASMAVSVMELAVRMVEQANVNAMSDAGVAFFLGKAALAGAGLNVRMNLVSIQDLQVKEGIQVKLREYEARGVTFESRLCKFLEERGGLHLE